MRRKLVQRRYRIPVVMLALGLCMACDDDHADESGEGDSSEPVLELHVGAEHRTLTRTQLLALPSLERVQIEGAGAYRDLPAMTMKAVPFAELMEGLAVEAGALIELRGADLFTATVSGDRLMQGVPPRARAYLAIEERDGQWPPVREGQPFTAGPFYLVWKDSEGAILSNEEWPFRVVSISVLPPDEDRYRALEPSADLATDHPARRGRQVFERNCMPCHTLNGAGPGHMGPDLNVPMGPTEYIQPQVLRSFIRAPSSVRSWRGSRMIGVSTTQMPDEELDDLIQYLEHMVTTRDGAAPTSQ